MLNIHTVSSIDPRDGGPSRTVPALCRYLAVRHPDWSIELATSRSELASLSAGQRPVLYHDHGQWLPINHASSVRARREQAPRVVSPRGMLSPWARRQKRWKKTLAWLLYARRDLANAAVLHATSDLERDELRAMGIRQPIAVIPNGVDFMPLGDGSDKRTQPPYVLFLSRVHEKKGIRELLDVWAKIDHGDWQLIIAGPDEQGLIKHRVLPPDVTYVGMVDGDVKQRLLAEASLFVLPSYSENFGVVIAEALNAGTPVITTHGTPWQALEEESCGWWIPMSTGHLAATLVAAMATPPGILRAMGARGMRLANQRFGWTEIADDMTAVYEWLIRGGSPPACVDVV
jgi:glycosyltransferase involved in cell wall biosynthesis